MLKCFLACSGRAKSKIYDDGIVVMQCASHRVATSHKFSLTIIFSSFFIYYSHLMFRCRHTLQHFLINLIFFCVANFFLLLMLLPCSMTIAYRCVYNFRLARINFNAINKSFLCFLWSTSFFAIAKMRILRDASVKI